MLRLAINEINRKYSHNSKKNKTKTHNWVPMSISEKLQGNSGSAKTLFTSVKAKLLTNDM